MDKLNEKADSLVVSLYIYGEKLDPEYISKNLCSCPTRSQKKGDAKTSKNGRISAKIGMWELGSGLKSLILSEHISEIVCRLGKNDVFIPGLDGVSDVHVDVYASSLIAGDGYRYLDLELSLADMLALGRIGASVRISIVDEDGARDN